MSSEPLLRALTTLDFTRANLPERYWRGCEFANVPVTAPYWSDVRRYLKNLPKMVDAGFGMFLFSPRNGTGKTAIATMAMVRAMQHGISSYFIRAAALQDSTIQGVTAAEEPIGDRLRSVRLLVIDDLGKEHKARSGYTASLIEDLVRTRVQSLRATVFTSNLEPKDIKEVYSVDLASAMKEATVNLHIVGAEAGGKDWRTDVRQDALAKFKELP